MVNEEYEIRLPREKCPKCNKISAIPSFGFGEGVSAYRCIDCGHKFNMIKKYEINPFAVVDKTMSTTISGYIVSGSSPLRVDDKSIDKQEYFPTTNEIKELIKSTIDGKIKEGEIPRQLVLNIGIIGQSQFQYQSQSQEIDITLHTNILNKIDEFEEDIKKESNKYDLIPPEELRDLKEVLSYIKDLNRTDAKKNILEKWKNSKFCKWFEKPSNMQKIANSLSLLTKLISVIEKVG